MRFQLYQSIPTTRIPSSTLAYKHTYASKYRWATYTKTQVDTHKYTQTIVPEHTIDSHTINYRQAQKHTYTSRNTVGTHTQEDTHTQIHTNTHKQREMLFPLYQSRLSHTIYYRQPHKHTYHWPTYTHSVRTHTLLDTNKQSIILHKCTSYCARANTGIPSTTGRQIPLGYIHTQTHTVGAKKHTVH